MREVNFSIPSANKASVGITTALYDRRALDCTSTLPLINSLNHLAYLTTSSARIREILTVDGGIERLVAILKNGRSKDIMDTWKWNLAFQCVVNIGVRGSDGKGSDSHGSENIRRRVVEADVVPVIATILDNYMQVIERLRASHDDPETTRQKARAGLDTRLYERAQERLSASEGLRTERRREAPPPIEIPPPPQRSFSAQLARPGAPTDVDSTHDGDDAGEGSSHREQHPILTPISPSEMGEGVLRHHTRSSSRLELSENPEPTPTPGHSRGASQADFPPPPVTSTWTPLEGSFPHHHYPSRDPFLVPPRSAASQPDALSTPTARSARRLSPSRRLSPLRHLSRSQERYSQGRRHSQERFAQERRHSQEHARERPRLARHQSTSGDSDDGRNELARMVESDGELAVSDTIGDAQDRSVDVSVSEMRDGINVPVPVPVPDAPSQRLELEPVVGIRDRMDLDDDDGSRGQQAMDSEGELPATNIAGEGAPEAFNITHRSLDGSLVDPAALGPAAPPGVDRLSPGRLSPGQPDFMPGPAPEPPRMHPSFYDHRYAQANTQPTSPTILASVPRDEDVVMSLQLLAYVSKYCDLRAYFQQTHLVPKLKIAREVVNAEAACGPGDVTPTIMGHAQHMTMSGPGRGLRDEWPDEIMTATTPLREEEPSGIGSPMSVTMQHDSRRRPSRRLRARAHRRDRDRNHAFDRGDVNNEDSSNSGSDEFGDEDIRHGIGHGHGRGSSVDFDDMGSDADDLGSDDEEFDANDLEFCQPNDYNIFPLVEKFTVRYHSPEMKYWAGVVMRNLCRKDKSRGDIRQCAYYKCGKWEEYARQFAKCRRCRQTKYCSKECQKSAWILHRFWCQPVTQTGTT